MKGAGAVASHLCSGAPLTRLLSTSLFPSYLSRRQGRQGRQGRQRQARGSHAADIISLAATCVSPVPQGRSELSPSEVQRVQRVRRVRRLEVCQRNAIVESHAAHLHFTAPFIRFPFSLLSPRATLVDDLALADIHIWALLASHRGREIRQNPRSNLSVASCKPREARKPREEPHPRPHPRLRPRPRCVELAGFPLPIIEPNISHCRDSRRTPHALASVYSES